MRCMPCRRDQREGKPPRHTWTPPVCAEPPTPTATRPRQAVVVHRVTVALHPWTSVRAFAALETTSVLFYSGLSYPEQQDTHSFVFFLFIIRTIFKVLALADEPGNADKSGSRNKLRDADVPRGIKAEKAEYKTKDGEKGGDRHPHTGDKGGSASGKPSGGSKTAVRSSGTVKKEPEGSVKDQKDSRTDKERESSRSARSTRGSGDLPATGGFLL